MKSLRRRNTVSQFARCNALARTLVLGVLAAAMLAMPDATQAQCSFSSATNTTLCIADTRSATATVVVAGGGPAQSQLQQALNGPNGPAIASALAQVLGPGSVSQTSSQTFHTYTTFGPSGPLPVGPGPGTINCSGLPSPPGGVGAWPVANCDFTGYASHTEAAGNMNILVDTHTSFATSVNIAANSAGLNFLLGDLHTTFQTTLLDDGFRFMSLLLSRGSEGGAVNGGMAGGLFSPAPLSFAADAMGSSAFDFEGAMAFATKAPRTPMTAAMDNGWRAWIRGTLARADFADTAANFGFRYRTGSAEGGIERVSGDWLYGAGFGLGQARVNQFTTGDHGTIGTIRGGAYASYRPGPWWITGAVAVGLSNIEATRLSLLPVQARSDYDATTISAGVEAARRIQTKHATFEPVAGLVYTGLRVDSFRETGTTFLDLAGSRADIDTLRGYAGGRIYRTFMAPNGSAWTPEVRGRLLYDFLDEPRGYTARFIADPAGTPIAVTGLQPDRFAVMLGGTLTGRLSATWHSFVSYDAEIRGGDVTHLVSGGVKGKW